MKLGLYLVLVFVISHVAIAVQPANDELVIEETYNEWVRVTNAKDIRRWLSFITPEAYFAPPGIPPLESTQEIADYYRTAFADPLFALDCRQLAVTVARSGDMGWARGICKVTFTDPSGMKGVGESKWVKIWLKQPDGSWKCALNAWSMNQ